MNNMDKLKLEDATDEQIRTFARTFLQLEGADAKAINAVRKDVSAAWPQGFIWVSKPVEQLPPSAVLVAEKPVLSKEQIEAKAGQGIAPTSSKTDPVVILTIAKTDQPGGKEPVFVNVNGNAMHIARGVKQAVPYRFWSDLVKTIQRLWTWDERENEMSYEDVTRFGMSIHQFPSEDEVFAFMELDARRSGQEYTRERFEIDKAVLMAA